MTHYRWKITGHDMTSEGQMFEVNITMNGVEYNVKHFTITPMPATENDEDFLRHVFNMEEERMVA